MSSRFPRALLAAAVIVIVATAQFTPSGNLTTAPAAAAPRAVPAAPGAAPAAASPAGAFFFHGLPALQDQVNKQASTPTATFDQSPPADTEESRQTSNANVAVRTQAKNVHSIYWSKVMTPAVAVGGLLRLKWYWSTANASSSASGASIFISVFAKVGSATTFTRLVEQNASLANLLPTPSLYTSFVSVPATAGVSELVIQVVPQFTDTGTGLFVHYDSTDTPSQFEFLDVAPNTPSVTFGSSDVRFAPPTIASAHWLGAEPQVTIERPMPYSQPDRIDPDRIYVDWPLSTRTQTGQLNRSLDGGDTFRLLFDRTCAVRNRPNCLTGGGGDTEEAVNLQNGNLYFSDQEAVANEALTSSTDHGDTWRAQQPVTNVALVADRQWLATTDGYPLSIASKRIDAFLAYHGGPITTVGQYVQAIDEDGNVVPQPGIGQVPGVTQSGPIRVDATNGPGRGWIYQSFYNGATGVKVATVRAEQYQDRFAWQVNDVSPLVAALMPWLQLDDDGNAYATWATQGVPYLSVAPIRDARNDPTKGGRPGTFWSAAVRISPPAVKSAVFVMNAAGAPGRVAIAYLGSEDCTVPANAATVVSDNCQLTATWRTHVSIIEDALALTTGGQATIVTGLADNRVAHRGSVCTAGTACTGDRSLLDLIDVGFDEDGRVGVVTMDNNNRVSAPNLTDNAKSGPFSIFAKQVSGPSLLGTTPISVTIPEDGRTDGAGDATWPHTAEGTNLPAFDLRGLKTYVAGGDLVAELSLADASAAGMTRDLAAYNTVQQTGVDPAARLQYVVRFSTANEVFHISLDHDASGNRRVFAGRLDANDVVTNGVGSNVGARYVSDSSFTGLSFKVVGNTLVLRGKLADFKDLTTPMPSPAVAQPPLVVGSRVFSVTAFATAGPPESNPTGNVMFNPSRTVDATPPFDSTLAEGVEPQDVSISINDVAAPEGNSGSTDATFTVTLSAQPTSAVSVNFGSADGTATAGSDYTAVSGSLVFQPGGQLTQPITVPVTGDTADEPDETFSIDLSGASGAVIADNRGQGTITDDDGVASVPTLSVNDVRKNEGNTGTTGFTFTVTRSGDTSGTSDVQFATQNGSATTADSDYQNVSGTLTFAANQTTQTINVPVNGDTRLEADETFRVNLSQPSGATIQDGEGTGTIANDDQGGSLRINDVTVTEGNSGTVNADFTVTRSGDTTTAASARFATANSTAAAPGDYTAQSGFVNFEPGQSTRPIRIAVKGDTTDESNEAFLINLSSPSNATIADRQGRGTITDDDPTPSLSVRDLAVTETDGTSHAIIRVSLSNASSKSISVRYATSDGTAKAGSDYTARSGTLSFSPGQTFRTVSVAIRGENLRETTEQFFLNLSNAVNATIADNRGTVTIRDDDPDDPLVLLDKSGPSEARPGTLVTYTLTYKNLGPFASANARMVDTLPAGVTLYSATRGWTYDRATRKVTWKLGTVATDATGTRRVTVRVPSNATNGTLLVNRVDFYGDQTAALPAFARTTVRR